jgi:hypothetical protein
MVLLSAAATANANPVAIKNYTDLVTAVESGQDVRAIVRFDRCIAKQRTDTSHYIGASTRINFDRYSHYKVKVGNELKDAVATSMTMMIEHPNGEFLYDYGRLRIYGDNTADFHAAYHDPVTNKLTYSMDWVCPVTDNAAQSGVVLFVVG